MNKSTMPRKFRLPKLYWYILIGVVLTVVISLATSFGQRMGLPGYLYAVGRCGGQPPVQATGLILFGKDTYILPGDSEYRIPKQNYERYFCTEKEAQDAGFQRLK